jgi:hypothetical protein
MSFYTNGGLREAARAFRQRDVLRKSADAVLLESVQAAARAATFNIFLSHSFLDAEEVLALKIDIEGRGFSVYVDWIQDAQLDRSKVTPATAARLRMRMRQCDGLLYAASPNAAQSKWMPWELGYFDGTKGRVAVLPVLEADPGSAAGFRGQEYLGLYPYITKDTIQGRNEVTLWVNQDPATYILLREWLAGRTPVKH